VMPQSTVARSLQVPDDDSLLVSMGFAVHVGRRPLFLPSKGGFSRLEVAQGLRTLTFRF
jgi:hypothetical protein